jgi:hypothetical protein
MSDQNAPTLKAGDKIKMPYFYMGISEPDWHIHEVVEFRQTLGIFESPEHKEAGELTPLCNLYYDGPYSEEKYISNYGTYRTNQVPAFIPIAGSSGNG